MGWMAPGAGGHHAGSCPRGWSRPCSTPQPWSGRWALTARPDPSWGCSGRRVGPRARERHRGSRVLPPAARARPALLRARAVLQAATTEQVPVPFPGDIPAVATRGRCRGQREPPREQEQQQSRSAAHPHAELRGPASFCPLAGTARAGSSVAVAAGAGCHRAAPRRAPARVRCVRKQEAPARAALNV